MRPLKVLVISLLAGLTALACAQAAPQGTGSTGGSTTSGSGGTTGGTTSGTGGTTGGQDGGPDAGPLDAGFVEAPHVSLPQVPNHGGPVLQHLKLVTITFGGYQYESEVQAFGDWIVGSSWLTTVGADYSVGLGTHLAKVVLDAGAPSQITSTELEAFLDAQMDAGVLPDPASDSELLYAIYYPAATTITMDPSGEVSCGSFGGYHAEAISGAYHFVYAVLPTCPPGNPVLPSELSQVETSASHEVIEAATDPRINTAPAYDITDGQNAWSYVPGEVGDLCNFQVTQVTTDGPDGGAWVQRIWSNHAAATGQNPCIPPSVSPYYFNVSPSPSNIIPLFAGQVTDVTLTGWSTGPMAAWFLLPTLSYHSFTPQFSLDQQTISNGAQVRLSVTAPAGTSSGNFAAMNIFSFGSDDGSIWPLVFVVQ
jgi:hypothetical protein